MEPSTIAAVILGTQLSAWDVLYRRAPNWITLPWLLAGIVVHWPVGLATAIVVWLIMDYAQFPAGDCKGAAALAAWVPWPVFLPAFGVTMFVTLLIMETKWYNLYHVAHRWAWLAGLGFALTISAICARLLGT